MNTKLMRVAFSCLLLVALALGQAMPAGAAEAEKAGTEKLPSAAEVIERFIMAIGGKKAYQEIESQHAKGTFSMPAQGMTGNLEVYAAKPNKLLIKVGLPAVGEMTTGYNGEVAWMANPATGPMLLTGVMAEQIREEADFDALLHDPENYQSLEVTGVKEFAGEKAYEVKAVKESGREQAEYFSTGNHLWLGFVGDHESPFGTVTVTNRFEDYKEIEGVKMPTKITQDMGAMKQVMNFEEIKINSVDPEVFALPPQVKALAEQNAEENK